MGKMIVATLFLLCQRGCGPVNPCAPDIMIAFGVGVAIVPILRMISKRDK